MNLVTFITFIILSLHFISCFEWHKSVEDFNNWEIEWTTPGTALNSTLSRCPNYKGEPLFSIVPDPINTSVKAIRIFHPKGSYAGNPSNIPVGCYLSVKPGLNSNTSTFEFEVYFHENFNFVLGGKLTGVFSGEKGCDGCNDNVTQRSNCFSARFMWGGKPATGGSNGKDLDGYSYLYLPLEVNHEQPQNTTVGNQPKCGMVSTKKQYFTRGQWTHIKQKVVLNTPGKANGILQVWVNGKEIENFTKLIYRTKNSILINKFILHPFFGGSSPSWATPEDTYTLWKNFKISSSI